LSEDWSVAVKNWVFPVLAAAGVVAGLTWFALKRLSPAVEAPGAVAPADAPAPAAATGARPTTAAPAPPVEIPKDESLEQLQGKIASLGAAALEVPLPERLARVKRLESWPKAGEAARGLVRLLGLVSPGSPADDRVREACVRALGNFIQEEKARGKLAERLTERAPLRERIAAAQGMGLRPSRWALPYLEKAKLTSDAELRRTVKRTLIAIKSLGRRR